MFSDWTAGNLLQSKKYNQFPDMQQRLLELIHVFRLNKDRLCYTHKLINGDFRFSHLIILEIMEAIQKMNSWWNCVCCSIVSFTFKTCYIQPKFILCRFSVLLFLKNITPIKSRSLAIALVVVRLSKLLTFVWKFLRFSFLSEFVFVFVITLVRKRLKISFSFWNLIRRLEKIYFKPHIKHRRGRASTI